MSNEVYSKDILAPIFADKVGEEWFVKRKMAFGPDGSYSDITSSTPLPTTDTGTQADINAFAAQNHTDLVAVTAGVNQVDSDLLAFKSANHTDLVAVTGSLSQLDTDLLAFKSANHTDLTQLDTDLLSFKSANHADLVAVTGTLTNGTQKTQISDISAVVGQQTKANSLPTVLASDQISLVSTLNSSSTPLGSNATFTGTAELISAYTAINVSIGVDQNGTLNIDYSANGTNWDQTESYALTVTTPGQVSGFFFQLMTEGSYYRLRFVNGASAQGTFRLQTILKLIPGTSEVQYIAQTLIDSTDALVTKGVIYGKTTGGGGGYVAVKVNPSGAMSVSLGDISGVVGQQTAAASLPVVIASDQIASATSTITRVASSATSVQLLASNTARKGTILFNESTQNCYVKFGTTASATSYSFFMTSNATVILEEFPIYTGRIDAIWAAANGAMQITELT